MRHYARCIYPGCVGKRCATAVYYRGARPYYGWFLATALQNARKDGRLPTRCPQLTCPSPPFIVSVHSTTRCAVWVLQHTFNICLALTLSNVLTLPYRQHFLPVLVPTVAAFTLPRFCGLVRFHPHGLNSIATYLGAPHTLCLHADATPAAQHLRHAPHLRADAGGIARYAAPHGILTRTVRWTFAHPHVYRTGFMRLIPTPTFCHPLPLPSCAVLPHRCRFGVSRTFHPLVTYVGRLPNVICAVPH